MPITLRLGRPKGPLAPYFQQTVRNTITYFDRDSNPRDFPSFTEAFEFYLKRLQEEMRSS